jgi:D-lactate dehydrogenase (cytochrome)
MAGLRLPLQRPPDTPPPPTVRDSERLDAVARDAAAMQGSGAVGLVEPRSEAELCAWLRANPDIPVLPQGALTSLTGGATPSGEVVISTARLTSLRIDSEEQRATVGAGLVLANLHEALAERGLYYPPAPTHDGATVGGNVACNAAGAATFAYGTTRDWVRRIRVVLRHGEVLELTRGQHVIQPGDTIELVGEHTLRVPVPTAPSPALRKTSAGYFVAADMDPIDLFIGAEGTLGIVTEVELALRPLPTELLALVFLPDDATAVALTHTLRERSMASVAGTRPGGLAVRSIEYFDARCLALIRQEGKLEQLRVEVPAQAGAALLLVHELPAGSDDAAVMTQLDSAFAGEPQGPIADLIDALMQHDALDSTELALPEQRSRQAQLAAVREAIPLAVSEWLLRHQRHDPAVHKLGGDMIVPFEHFAAMLEAYRRVFAAHGLEVCVYGHISDGNVHPNGLPTCAADVAAGEAALLELARRALDLGGCPLSEHGVGRSLLKQRLLAMTRGPQAVDQLRATKLALDPGWTLAPGVLFPSPADPTEAP